MSDVKTLKHQTHIWNINSAKLMLFIKNTLYIKNHLFIDRRQKVRGGEGLRCLTFELVVQILQDDAYELHQREDQSAERQRAHVIPEKLINQ